MSYEIRRRGMLRLSAVGAVGGALAAAAAPAARASTTGAIGRTAADAAADHIVASVRRPWFPGRYFPVTDFGAKGDGTTLDTQAFAKAIAVCHRAGGGHVVVPAGGTFLAGAIHLLSNVDLHVEQNATILFSQNPAGFLPVVFTRWQASS
jgi:polygalacturonase